MIRLVLILFFSLATALPGGLAHSAAMAASRDGGAIRTITVVGNKRIDSATIIAHLALRAGEPFSAAKADESVKNLFATGLFSDTAISFKGGIAVVTVAENPIVNRVAFEGNKEIKSEDLAKEVQLKAPESFSRGKVAGDVGRLLDVYRRQGYYAAKIEPKTIEAGAGRVDVVFEIDEGPQTKVAAINFLGNRAFSAAELRAVITTTQSNLLDFLRSTSIYDPDRFNLDRELLRRHYLKHGYADMRISSAFADADPEGKGFFLTFAIEEGPRYTFGHIDVETTVPGLGADDLHGVVLTRPGDIYNVDLIDKSVEAITLALADRGHPFAGARPRIERDAKGHTISLAYVIEQGARTYIERIEITGNRHTNDAVIRRELGIADGDPYNPVLAERARRRVMKLGFFKSVKIAKERGSAPGRVVLNVAVVEDSTGELSFAAGYSSNDGIIGEIGYNERNLFGSGQSLQVKLAGSLVSGSAQVSWTEPRILDRNLSFGVDAFVRNNDYRQGEGFVAAGFEDLRAGGGFRFGVALSETVSVNTSYTLMRDMIYNVDPDASLAVKQIKGNALISQAGHSVAYDGRDKAGNPMSGLYVRAGQDIAGLGGDVNYIRTTSEMRGYYPIAPEITLAARGLGGNITGWGGQSVRIVDAFFKGGETIRGFASGGLGPRDGVTGNALGGTTFYAATAEVRFALPLVPEEFGLRGAVFTDAGSLFGTDAHKFAALYARQHGGANTLAVKDSAIVRASAGVSLIWDSPIGPLRVDYAKALQKAPFDKTKAFRFGASGW